MFPFVKFVPSTHKNLSMAVYVYHLSAGEDPWGLLARQLTELASSRSMRESVSKTKV